MSTTKGTTPTFHLLFNSDTLDLTTATNVYVTLTGQTTITKSGEDLAVEEKSIDVHITQEESLALGEGVIEIQANWTYGSERAASTIVRHRMTRQLLGEVIE